MTEPGAYPPEVAAVLAELNANPARPLEEQVDRLEAAHERLQQLLDRRS